MWYYVISALGLATLPLTAYAALLVLLTQALVQRQRQRGPMHQPISAGGEGQRGQQPDHQPKHRPPPLQGRSTPQAHELGLQLGGEGGQARGQQGHRLGG